MKPNSCQVKAVRNLNEIESLKGLKLSSEDVRFASLNQGLPILNEEKISQVSNQGIRKKQKI